MKKSYEKKLMNIDVLSRSINDVYSKVVHEDKIKCDFIVESSIAANTIEKKIKIILDVTINSNVLNEEPIVCGVTRLAFLFELNKDEQVINDKEYDAEVLLDLCDIAISTARGIIWDSFRGTYLHDAILPIMMVQSHKQNGLKKVNNE